MDMKAWRAARRKAAGGVFRLSTRRIESAKQYTRKRKHKNKETE